MNFLAHLHIAKHCKSNLAGNLLGDFVKGDPSKYYSNSLSDGIRLHRFVDSYTDLHDVSRSAKSLFSHQTRRFAPIALDVFWDHCLANHWAQFSTQSLERFCVDSHQQIFEHQEPHWPEHFITVHQKMAEQRWLLSYQDMPSIEVVLQRMALRRPKLGMLKSCYHDLEHHYNTLQCHFHELYPSVLEEAKQFNSLEMKKNQKER
ncbi:ACP phosphodiesterase [Vibrio atlanticus]|uniref:acyl carrier protein phosphodiesterase n=1 Tax=Vibrio atlanticus TaxID=693153 RepID=UPI0022AE9EF9|nr:ACP phosphodiesterase [Vibrio atlanticus]MCZ4309955.1 ACP phosphodiesterase [Vibrio atlanticus]